MGDTVWSNVWVLIPIAAIIGGITYSIMTAKYRSQEKAAKHTGGSDLRNLIEQNMQVNQQLLNKLESMDARLASVEKTLTDIP